MPFLPSHLYRKQNGHMRLWLGSVSNHLAACRWIKRKMHPNTDANEGRGPACFPGRGIFALLCGQFLQAIPLDPPNQLATLSSQSVFCIGLNGLCVKMAFVVYLAFDHIKEANIFRVRQDSECVFRGECDFTILALNAAPIDNHAF